jgi:mRNA-degrading endonuclease RelE of RelBE toxin-antitoxin system
MEIKYSEKAENQLKKICKGDKKSASMIMEVTEAYSKEPRRSFDIKTLKGKHGDFKRLRMGKYRIIFVEDADAMYIYEIKHRQEAYHD